jgi:hypothetical protein
MSQQGLVENSKTFEASNVLLDKLVDNKLKQTPVTRLAMPPVLLAGW